MPETAANQTRGNWTVQKSNIAKRAIAITPETKRSVFSCSFDRDDSAKVFESLPWKTTYFVGLSIARFVHCVLTIGTGRANFSAFEPTYVGQHPALNLMVTRSPTCSRPTQSYCNLVPHRLQ